MGTHRFIPRHRNPVLSRAADCRFAASMLGACRRVFLGRVHCTNCRAMNAVSASSGFIRMTVAHQVIFRANESWSQRRWWPALCRLRGPGGPGAKNRHRTPPSGFCRSGLALTARKPAIARKTGQSGGGLIGFPRPRMKRPLEIDETVAGEVLLIEAALRPRVPAHVP